MTAAGAADRQRAAGGQHTLTRAEIFDLLSNDRRRGVVHYLLGRDDPVEVDELVEAVASREADGPDAGSRASVYSSLVQTHLPRLAAARVVNYDRTRNVVAPADRLGEVQVYLEYSPGRDIPWAEYYLGLAAVAAALVTVVWLAVPPFDRLSGIAAAVVLAAVLLVSATVHLVETRRSRLGAGRLDDAREPE